MSEVPTASGRPRRHVRLPLLAGLAFALGAAGLPGPKERVEVVQPAAVYTFTCILHREGIAAPGVGVLTLVSQAPTGR